MSSVSVSIYPLQPFPPLPCDRFSPLTPRVRGSRRPVIKCSASVFQLTRTASARGSARPTSALIRAPTPAAPTRSARPGTTCPSVPAHRATSATLSRTASTIRVSIYISNSLASGSNDFYAGFTYRVSVVMFTLALGLVRLRALSRGGLVRYIYELLGVG